MVTATGDAKLVQEGCLSVAAAAELMGVGRTHLYCEMGSGRLRFVRIGKRRLIPRAEIHRYLVERLAAERTKA
jgi:excisionase family DNA binding protein